MLSKYNHSVRCQLFVVCRAKARATKTTNTMIPAVCVFLERRKILTFCFKIFIVANVVAV